MQAHKDSEHSALFKHNLQRWWCTYPSHDLICDMTDHDKRLICEVVGKDDILCNTYQIIKMGSPQ